MDSKQIEQIEQFEKTETKVPAQPQLKSKWSTIVSGNEPTKDFSAHYVEEEESESESETTEAAPTNASDQEAHDDTHTTEHTSWKDALLHDKRFKRRIGNASALDLLVGNMAFSEATGFGTGTFAVTFTQETQDVFDKLGDFYETIRTDANLAHLLKHFTYMPKNLISIFYNPTEDLSQDEARDKGETDANWRLGGSDPNIKLMTRAYSQRVAYILREKIFHTNDRSKWTLANLVRQIHRSSASTVTSLQKFLDHCEFVLGKFGPRDNSNEYPITLVSRISSAVHTAAGARRETFEKNKASGVTKPIKVTKYFSVKKTTRPTQAKQATQTESIPSVPSHRRPAVLHTKTVLAKDDDGWTTVTKEQVA